MGGILEACASIFTAKIVVVRISILIRYCIMSPGFQWQQMQFYIQIFLLKFCSVLRISNSLWIKRVYCIVILSFWNNPGVQGKNNTYHNVNNVQNSFIDTLILNLIDIVACIVFTLYSRIGIFILNFSIEFRWSKIFFPNFSIFSRNIKKSKKFPR